MRGVLPEKLQNGRVRDGRLASDPSDGPNGCFHVHGPCGAMLTIVSSAARRDVPWEHVSVSTPRRCPNWPEMSFVKGLFWDDEECVVEFHPPRSRYVNNHEFCLHLWRPTHFSMELPPSILVGILGATLTTLR